MINPTFALYHKGYLTKQLSLEGETWISTTPYPQLVLTLKEVVALLAEDEAFDEPYKFLVKARLSLAHNLILDKPVGSLVDETLGNYKKFL